MITDNMVALTKAWLDGDDSARIALHDLLIEEGYPSTATWHLENPDPKGGKACRPSACVAVKYILNHDAESLADVEDASRRLGINFEREQERGFHV